MRPINKLAAPGPGSVSIVRVTKGRIALALFVALVAFVIWRGWPPPANTTTIDVDGRGIPNATLMPGLGELHHPIGATSNEAQRFFDQGLTFYYAFNFLEAMHSFQRSAALAPGNPMPFWGIALARGPNYNSGYISDERQELSTAAIRRAQGLEATSTPEERALIGAFALRVSDDPDADPAKMAQAYSGAMRGVADAFPDDPDAATLYAESLMDLHAWRMWTPEGRPADGTDQTLVVLKGVLQRWPNHLGANHLLIHALEASPFPERALPAARLLPRLAPGAGHLMHMPAHILLRIGDYAGAVAANEQAEAADERYETGRTIKNRTYEIGYEQHNLRFLAYAAEMDGDFSAAFRAAQQLQAEVSPEAEANALPLYMLMVRFGRWQEILKLAPPLRSDRVAAYFWRFARASAMIATAGGEGARAEMVGTLSAGGAVPETGVLPMGGPWPVLRQVVSETLAARMAAARGDWTAAVADWQALVAAEDGIGYGEPPAWYPLRESLGASLLRAGRAPEAEAVFRELLRQTPKDPRGYLGLWQALAAEHKTAEATKMRGL